MTSVAFPLSTNAVTLSWKSTKSVRLYLALVKPCWLSPVTSQLSTCMISRRICSMTLLVTEVRLQELHCTATTSHMWWRGAQQQLVQLFFSHSSLFHTLFHMNSPIFSSRHAILSFWVSLFPWCVLGQIIFFTSGPKGIETDTYLTYLLCCLYLRKPGKGPVHRLLLECLTDLWHWQGVISACRISKGVVTCGTDGIFRKHGYQVLTRLFQHVLAELVRFCVFLLMWQIWTTTKKTNNNKQTKHSPPSKSPICLFWSSFTTMKESQLLGEA